MKKKGFTLIELLAVIVILAIIALIVMPVIGSVIESSKKASYRESVNNTLEAAKNYVAEYILEHKNDDLNYPVEFICSGITCEDSNGNTLNVRGNLPKGGKIILYRDGAYAEYLTDGSYCALGYKGSLDVSKECNNLDITGPVINNENVVLRSTSNSVILSFPITIMADPETGISKYQVNLYTIKIKNIN